METVSSKIAARQIRATKILTLFECFVPNILNTGELSALYALPKGATAGWLLRYRFWTFAQVCSRESTDEYSTPRGATHFTC